MPIIANKPVEITDREALAFTVAEVINDALIGDKQVSPLEVAQRILLAIDGSGIYIEAPKRPTLPRRPGTMLDVDALIAADNDAA
jgi:hypothetical protein